jgi:hypothetical protein
MKRIMMITMMALLTIGLFAETKKSTVSKVKNTINDARVLNFKAKYAVLLLQNKTEEAQKLLDDLLSLVDEVSSIGNGSSAKNETVTNVVTITNIIFITNSTAAPAPAAAQPQPAVSAMSDSDFDSMMEEINKANFPEDKIEIIRQSGKHNNMSIKQIMKLLDLYTFDDDRLKVVHYTYNNPPDKSIAYKLYNYFQWEKSKNEVKSLIESKE